MAKLLLVVELEYDESIMHEDDDEGRAWFRDSVLRVGQPFDPDDGLILHTNYIGDDLGTVRVLEVRTPEA